LFEFKGETITAIGRIEQGEIREAWEIVEGKGGTDREITARQQNNAWW